MSSSHKNIYPHDTSGKHKSETKKTHELKAAKDALMARAVAACQHELRRPVGEDVTLTQKYPLKDTILFVKVLFP
jgi:hypothetical protein